jgi:hypothetical protein
MQATGYAEDIWVRRLTEEEKKADPDHDFELFKEISTLKGAEMLGWPKLNATVFDIDEWEGVRLHEATLRHSQPLTWVEVYAGMERILTEYPHNTVGQLAIKLQKDPVVAAKVLPVVKLLNESAQKAIWQSLRSVIEEGIDMGGYRFVEELAIPLKRLEGFSKNLLETQRTVEKVVGIAIENEMGYDEIGELVDWVLAGNDPDEYFEKEA